MNEHYATLDALARERKTLHGRAPTELEALQAEAGTGPRRRSTGRWRPGRRWSTSIDARRDLNAQLTGELQERPAEAPGVDRAD